MPLRAPKSGLPATTAVRIGLLGFGTVGSAFAAVLEERRGPLERRFGVRLVLTQIAVARPARRREGTGSARVHGDAAALAADRGLDVVVEATGARQAGAWLLAAHARGATVVTANKQALVGEPALLELLARHDPRLLCEAAAGAAVPVVRALRGSLAADRVLSLRGVLNGTTTYVLTRLEEGVSLERAVAEAQRAGYAEADPSDDLLGRDAAAKLVILCTFAWGEPVGMDNVEIHGLEQDAAERVREARAAGRRLRLLAEASLDGPEEPSASAPAVRVAPVALEAEDPLAATGGVEAIVEARTTLAGRLIWRGAGAGGRATGSALLADTLAAARAIASGERT